MNHPINTSKTSSSSSTTSSSTTSTSTTLTKQSNWWPISPSHAHQSDENISPQINHWRSPIKPESKDYIANLPLPPLEAMLAAVGDAHVVRLVCKRWRDARPLTHICVRNSVSDDVLRSARRGDCQLERIRITDVEFCNARNSDAFAQLMQLQRRTLKAVHFVYCTVTGAELEAASQSLFDFRELRLSSCFVQLERADDMTMYLGASGDSLQHFEAHATTRRVAPRIQLPSLGLHIAELPTSLRTLVLGGQTITSACARALPQLTRLRALRAARFENDEDLAVLRLLPELETLAIGGISSESGYAAIGDVRSLRRLALWWQADECVPMLEAALANDRLLELDLNPGQFTTHLLPRVVGLASLERLVLRSIALSDDTLELRDLPRLHTLSFSRCRFAPSETLLDDTVEHVPSLRTVVFHATVPKQRCAELLALRERFAATQLHIDIDSTISNSTFD